jgi:predicted ester cyclase
MSVEANRSAVSRYLSSNHSDLSMMAPDVVFTNMATGDEHRGVEAVSGMLNFVYHVAFDAKAEQRSLIVTDTHAVLEADFVGRHIGEFAGKAATGRTVRVPLCVVYDMTGGKIARGRIYFEVPSFFAQVS